MPRTLVHYYDTTLRRIACGVRGFDHRSTKHVRGVTCPACLGVVGERPGVRDLNAPGTSLTGEALGAVTG